MSEDLVARVEQLEREKAALVAALSAQLTRLGPRNGDVVVARCEDAEDTASMRKLAEFITERLQIEALIITMPFDKDVTQLDAAKMAEAGWYRADVYRTGGGADD